MEIDRYLKDGDSIELEVEGIGVLRNRIAGAI
jgi:2-keto-4-pentenoate hydratase/2-oxohepta-3-ene-1,7-dioic acid hydratase in catechol pathway